VKKTVHIISLLALTLVAGCAGMQKDMGYKEYSSPEDWATKTMTGPFLPLAKEADVWSETKTFNMSGGQVGVQSKFIEQQGTTCTFQVKFTNNGANTVAQGVSLTRENLGEGYDRHTVDGKEGVYAHRVTNVSVAPGKAVWYEMEKRECPLKWGTSKEMQKCAECSPALVFIK
jgi:hypothetical protein